MSLRSLLNREVHIRPMGPGDTPTTDDHGNEVIGAGADSPPIPARRDQSGASEVDAGRDQQTATVRYTLPVSVWIPGDPGSSYTVELTGRDRIVDGDEVFEIIGSPELVYRRRQAHHWEAVARLVEG